MKFTKQNRFGRGGQSMVEFAIVLPVLLALLIGIMEVGRMIFMYTLVTNASRDAVRFASVVGRSDNGNIKYKYCMGIKKVAKTSGYILNLQNSDIVIGYILKSGSTATCDYTTDGNNGAGEDPDIQLDSTDRVRVTISVNYTPLIKLIPFPARTFTATSTRTILGIYDLQNP